MENKKTKAVALVLAFFLGGYGAQKFYLGKTAAGILSVIFCWTFIPCIIAWIDIIIIACMDNADFDRKYNPKPMAWERGGESSYSGAGGNTAGEKKHDCNTHN